MPTPAALFASFLFSTIGVGAFMYAKRTASWSPAMFGLALMVYPWFVSQTWLLYVIGVALCLGLYYFRE